MPLSLSPRASLFFIALARVGRSRRSPWRAALGVPLVALSFTLILASCGDDPASPETQDAVLDATACVCEGGCPADLCDVRVELESDCVGKLEEAEVLIDGTVVGVVTLSTPFASCEAYPCDTVLDLEVRGGGFSTGTKRISVLLDPDVPYSCINLP